MAGKANKRRLKRKKSTPGSWESARDGFTDGFPRKFMSSSSKNDVENSIDHVPCLHATNKPWNPTLVHEIEAINQNYQSQFRQDVNDGDHFRSNIVEARAKRAFPKANLETSAAVAQEATPSSEPETAEDRYGSDEEHFNTSRNS